VYRNTSSMKFRRKITGLVFFLLCGVLVTQVEARKRYKKKTGMDCLQCHTSKKGGTKNLTDDGNEYELYRLISKKLRRKKNATEDLKERDPEKYELYSKWKDLEKKIREERIKEKMKARKA